MKQFLAKIGSSFTHEMTIRYKDGTPIPLTGSQVSADLVQSPGGAPVVQFSVGAKDLPGGVVQLLLSSSDTSSLEPDLYFYDVKIVANLLPFHTETFSILFHRSCTR